MPRKGIFDDWGTIIKNQTSFLKPLIITMLKNDTLIEKNFIGYLITSLNGHWLAILDCEEPQNRSRQKDSQDYCDPSICAVRPQQCSPLGKFPWGVGNKSSSCFIVWNWKVCHCKSRARNGDRSNRKVNLLQNSTLIKIKSQPMRIIGLLMLITFLIEVLLGHY